MSCKKRRKITWFLFVVPFYLHTFQDCHSLSFAQQEDGFTAHQVPETNTARWESITQHNDVLQGNWRLVERVIGGRDLRKSNQPSFEELRPEVAAFHGKPSPYFNTPKLVKTDTNFAQKSRSWTTGDISSEPRLTSNPGSEDEYQADFTGFGGVQGKVLGPSLDSSPHFSEWLAMRPLLQCDDNVMTFIASGEGLKHLFVDRKGASPISLFQLPSSCGYTVKTSWSDLEMMVPYDACYITKENGSYVLPLLWWGSPLKLSCPVQMATPAPPPLSPSVFCSPYGMALQLYGLEQDILLLGVMVNGAWGPLVSEECAHHVPSSPGELTFFISYSAPCITNRDGLHLQLVLDDQEYILSCPVNPQSPNVPLPPSSTPPSPGDPQVSYIPDPVSPVPTSPPSPPPQPPTQKQIAQLPEYPDFPYPGFQYPQLPQVYPPGPEPARPPRPTPGSPPGPQPQQQQQFLYPTELSKLPYSPGDHPKYPSPPYLLPVEEQAPSSPDLSPVQDNSPSTHQVSKLPAGPPQYPSGVYYPYVPFYYPAVTPAPTLAAKIHTTTTTTAPPATQPPSPPASIYYPQYYLQIPFYPAPTAAPVTQAPVKEEPQTIPQEPQKPVAPQATSPSYMHTICGYYPYPYYPYYHSLYPLHYHPPYPPVPHQTQPPVTTKKPLTTTTAPTTTTPTTESPTVSTPPDPTPQIPHLQCLMGNMVVFLPSAHPDSIQVRDQMKTWLFLSSVPSLCGYVIQMAEDSGVILHSPLPACHSVSQTPTTISLPLRFWDLSIEQYRTLDLQCPYQTAPETPAPVIPSVSPIPSSTSKIKVSPAVVSKPKVFCSTNEMTVELPSGPLSEIVVKDVKGNTMTLQDAPKHCGYSARKGKEGRIQLSLQLHSRCHMSVQGTMCIITVVYMTINGRREAQFFCPLLTPKSGQECNLPSEQRLPCGSSSVSQPQCHSMGCCFSKQPPACYYPMDECTIDRHFVFYVPASLTEPPLSPALLVAAGNSTCRPERVTSDYALFKIPMDGCGTRRVMVGKTMIYMVEIINKVQSISLNYGTITRDSPVRLLVECRYLPNTVLSVSYMVKTPSLGPAVHTQGVFGVQLRIAKDAQYSSYYPQYHQPLQMLLGKPLYLEVRLINTPDPSLVLLVHFCVAYPRSGKAVWLLLYNGCPNPLDPASQQAVLFDPRPPTPQAQTRRFTISTFQFLPDGEFKDPDEEIYFMCSTEICSPRDGPCVEGCFGQ